NQKKRRFVLPDFNAGFTFDHEMIRHERLPGTGASALEAAGIPDSDRDDWLLGISGTLPLFESGGRVFDVRKARADLDQLKSTYERIRQLTEKLTRNTIYGIESSHPNIRLSREAADRAHKNLEIVREKYAQGTVSILDLLDAQNQALVEDRSASIAVYDYLKDLYAFQRAISWFQDTKTSEEKREWVTSLNAFLKKNTAQKSGTP
ncbi:unnamed protein product, partial [marine sediment metagenome]